MIDKESIQVIKEILEACADLIKEKFISYPTRKEHEAFNNGLAEAIDSLNAVAKSLEGDSQNERVVN